ncbi:uncharacterized protein LOC102066075 isoform X3 [Zonotrichia albicollis]|uniref:uncharacterized protein LOC102066075 isoform X3 n=1 Tax=Zonotrichia albicollis TaxID=44394 RepID=UPI000EAAEAF8|nr:uncharacterized protein LOC102066075 isoform X3 [Zonotrichia albicollis]
MARIQNHTAALPFLQKRILALQQERHPWHFLPFLDLSQPPRGALGRRARSTSGGSGAGARAGRSQARCRCRRSRAGPGRCRCRRSQARGRCRWRSRRSARHSRGSSARRDGAESAGCEPYNNGPLSSCGRFPLRSQALSAQEMPALTDREKGNKRATFSLGSCKSVTRMKKADVQMCCSVELLLICRGKRLFCQRKTPLPIVTRRDQPLHPPILESQWEGTCCLKWYLLSSTATWETTA